MSAAVDAGLIATSPCARVPLPRVERRDTNFLNPGQVADLADAVDARYRAMILLGAYGGLRSGELFGLRRDRVDRLRGRIEVSEITVEVKGKITFGPPKTRAGRRVVPVPGFVGAAVSTHLSSRPPGGDELVFAAPEGGPVRLSLWRRRFWAPAVRRAGLEPLRVHDLRHSAVALWIAAGATPTEIAARAGHASVVTVLDRYGHLLPGSDQRVTEALEVLARGATASPIASVEALPTARGS
jgi:integrase